VFTDTVFVRQHLTSTINSIVINWKSIPVIPGDPDLLTANPCWPATLFPDAEPGFALRNDDPYYSLIPTWPRIYTVAPDSLITCMYALRTARGALA
jgi:hypothetical protein